MTSLARARAAWDRHWFPESPALPLALVRLWVVPMALFASFPTLAEQTALLESWDSLRQPQLLVSALARLLSEPWLRSEAFFVGLAVVAHASAALAFVGFRTRAALGLFAIAHAIGAAHVYSYGEFHHPKTVLALFLFCLAAGDTGRALSVDAWLAARRAAPPGTRPGWRRLLGLDATSRFARWPIQMLWLIFGLVYLDAAVKKLVLGGPEWLNGTTLQHYALLHAMMKERVPALWLASQHGLCVALGWATIAIEGGFWLAAIAPRLRPLFWIGGLGLHLGLDYFLYQGDGRAWLPWWSLYFALLAADVWVAPLAWSRRLAAASSSARST